MAVSAPASLVNASNNVRHHSARTGVLPRRCPPLPSAAVSPPGYDPCARHPLTPCTSAHPQAGNDEIVHAKLCFGLAHKYGGKRLAPGPFPIENGIVDVETDLAGVVGAVAYEGGIGETLSVVRAAAQLAQVQDPEARTVLQTIVSDEARHAGLAWKTMRWALKSGKEDVRTMIETQLARSFDDGLERELSAEEQRESDILAAHGIMDDSRTAEIDRDHHKWLLPAMTKALLEDAPVQLSHTTARSKEVNAAVRALFDVAGFGEAPASSPAAAAAAVVTPEDEAAKQSSAAAIAALREDQRRELGQRWANNGLGEHASVASFARFTVRCPFKRHAISSAFVGSGPSFLRSHSALPLSSALLCRRLHRASR